MDRKSLSIGEKYHWYRSQVPTFNELDIRNFINENETEQGLGKYVSKIQSITVFNVETTTLEDLLHTDHLDEI